jgi:hypothetical protein
MAGPDAVRVAPSARLPLPAIRVRREPSDWHIAPEARDCSDCSSKDGPTPRARWTPCGRARIDDWLARRLAHVAAGRSRIVVSHEDLRFPRLARSTGREWNARL